MRVLAILAYVLVAAAILAVLYFSFFIATGTYEIGSGNAYLLLLELGHNREAANPPATRCGIVFSAFALCGTALPLACTLTLAVILARRFASGKPIRAYALLHTILCGVGAIGIALLHSMHDGFALAHSLTLPEDTLVARSLADDLWIESSAMSFAVGALVWGIVGSVLLGAGLLAGLLGRRVRKVLPTGNAPAVTGSGK